MSFFSTIRSLASAFLQRTRVNREMEDELRSHLQHRADDLQRAGISRTEAERRARLEFGGFEKFREEAREALGGRFVETLFQDIRFSVRSLRRTPGLTVFVIVTLALGIGMVSGTFSMVDALIFRPYPVPHPSGIVTLVSTTHDSSFDDFSYREYLDLRDKTQSYAGVIANSDMKAVGFSADASSTPRVTGGMMVSGNYLHVLGVEPQLGRNFRLEEDQVPGRDAVVVLSPEFWRREFGGDPAVINRHVRLNGVEFTVIGVAPEKFPGMQIFDRPDFYIPLAMAPVFSTDLQKNFFEDRDDRELNVKARLKPGATLQQAQNEIAVLAKNFESEYPKANLGRGAAVHTQFEMRTRVDDANWKFTVIFVVLALAVLLVACTNVAGLLLSRGRARAREIAIRLSIGAGRSRLIRLLMTESLILASLGGLGGVAIGYAFVEWFHTFDQVVLMTDLPLALPFRMDTRVLLASLALAMLSAVLCGLAGAGNRLDRRDHVTHQEGHRDGHQGRDGAEKCDATRDHQDGVARPGTQTNQADRRQNRPDRQRGVKQGEQKHHDRQERGQKRRRHRRREGLMQDKEARNRRPASPHNLEDGEQAKQDGGQDDWDWTLHCGASIYAGCGFPGLISLMIKSFWAGGGRSCWEHPTEEQVRGRGLRPWAWVMHPM